MRTESRCLVYTGNVKKGAANLRRKKVRPAPSQKSSFTRGNSPGNRRSRVRLTEDEADLIICLRRMGQKEYTLQEVMRRLGYEVARPV